jgi:hypothetical protein
VTVADIRLALAELGFSPESIQAVKRAWETSYDAAQVRLAEMKTAAKAEYRRLARELHPDLTGGDADKTEHLKRINVAWEQVEKFQLPPPRPPMMKLIIGNGRSRYYTTVVNGFGFGFTATNSGTSTSG